MFTDQPQRVLEHLASSFLAIGFRAVPLRRPSVPQAGSISRSITAIGSFLRAIAGEAAIANIAPANANAIDAGQRIRKGLQQLSWLQPSQSVELTLKTDTRRTLVNPLPPGTVRQYDQSVAVVQIK